MEARLIPPELLKKQFDLQEQDLHSYSPLTLAYIGDAVFDILVRTVLVSRGNAPADKLTKKASKIVCAERQSAMIRALKEQLSDEEREIYRRGRNAKSNSKAKNASTADYRRATGFEALVGYLYLQQKHERVASLIAEGIRLTETEKKNKEKTKNKKRGKSEA